MDKTHLRINTFLSQLSDIIENTDVTPYEIDDYEELCNANHEITKTEINNLKEDRAKIKGAMVATTLIGGAIGGVVGLLAKIGFKIGV